MNRIRKVILLGISIAFSGILNLQAQEGKLFIENFPPSAFQSEEYDAGFQIFSIIQDNNEIFYFANPSGILEYDGINWRKVDGTEGNSFYAFEKDKTGKIYCAGQNQMGYLKPDSSGKIVYHQLPNKDSSNYTVKKIISIQSGIYFISDENLYCWNGKELKKWNNWIPDSRMFKLNDNIFINVPEKGLFKLVNDSLQQFSGSNLFAGLNIIELIKDEKNENRILVFTSIQGIYEFVEKKINKINSGVNEILKDTKVLKVYKSLSGSFAIGTIDKGILVFDKSFSKYKVIDEISGIYNNKILCMYEDYYGSLWAGLEKGISKINYPSNLSHFDKSKGVDEVVYSIILFKGQLFIGTNHGIFKYIDEGNDNNHFLKVSKLNDEVWNIINYKDNLLVASTSGICKIEENSYRIISNEKAKVLYPSNFYPDRIFIGLNNGLASMIYKNGNWEYEGKIQGINHEVRTIEETADGKLWAGYEEISRVDFSKGIKNPQIMSLDEKNGLVKEISQIEVHKIKNKIYFGTDKGIYHFNEDSLKLVPDSTFGKRFYFHTRESEAFLLREDNKGNVWLTSDNKNGSLIPSQNTYKFDTIPLIKMPRTEVWAIYPEDDGIVWLGTTDGLYRYDPNIPVLYKKQYNTLIRKVKLNSDSTIFYGSFSDASGNASSTQTSLFKYILPHKNNDINFEYSTTNFDLRDKLLYSYILIGKDKIWSPWTKETKKEYTGLYEGNYIFKVKSKNVYGIEGKEASFEFTVLPPWFRTWWAIWLWVSLVILIVYAIIKLNFQRLRRAKHRLERIVKERTKEIQQQKEIIELEKDKSDKLLLNILPIEVADELKQTGKSAAKSFESVTVLFTDIKDFTKISENQTPEKLVAEIDFCFRAFDFIIERHGLEKIKTIGDAYMCAGGLPVKNETHPDDVVLAALEIRDFINQLKEERIKKNQSYFEVRIGISTGPVVAGIVGNKKFAYDIWGDTVNTASRMESTSETGKVNISGTTYGLIKEKFNCTYRGKIAAKNKGDVDMYFVESLKV